MKQPDTAPRRLSVTVSMLGGFCLEAGGRRLTDEVNRSQKPWNVLCYLIVHRDRNVSKAELMKLLWSKEKAPTPSMPSRHCSTGCAPCWSHCPEDMPPILSQRGSYSWNREIDRGGYRPV